MTPALDLSDITLPVGDTTTVRTVLNAYLRDQVKALHALPVRWLSASTRALYAQTLRTLAPLLKTNPRPVVAALRQPTLGALLNTLRHETHPEGDHAAYDRWTRELLLLLLFELALAQALPEQGVRVTERRLPALRHIGRNTLLAPDATVEGVDFLPGRIVLHSPEGEATFTPETECDGPWRLTHPFPRIVDGIHLALSDNNPLSHFEAHPDKQGNALDLGGKPVDEWLESLRACFKLVDEHLPLLGEELRLVLRLIVPVGHDAERHLSASYQEAIGTLYLTLHPNDMTMAEALVHEFQHNKLNAALHLGAVLENAFHPLYASPVRPDPRPLHGVVLAVHAFQAVAALYESMTAKGHPSSANPAWRRRFRDIIRMDREGARTVLSNGRPTPFGKTFLDEMRRLDEHLADFERRHWETEATTPIQALPE